MQNQQAQKSERLTLSNIKDELSLIVNRSYDVLTRLENISSKLLYVPSNGISEGSSTKVVESKPFVVDSMDKLTVIQKNMDDIMLQLANLENIIGQE